MSQPFDVFFSYSWATDTGEVKFREWCRSVADLIVTSLRLRFNSGKIKFHHYLDRNQIFPGASLDETLETAINNSRIFVAMVSSYYNTEYCIKEADWFRKRIQSAEWEFAKRLCILHVQDLPTDKHWWPDALTDKNNKPLNSERIFDDDGWPLGWAHFCATGMLTAEIVNPIKRIVLDISTKVENIRREEETKAAYKLASERFLQPVLFFEAEKADSERWNYHLPKLEEGHSIVMPIPGPKAATGVEWTDWQGCDGLVMLRSRFDDDIGRRMRAAHQLRRQLYSCAGSNATAPPELLRCVLLDEQDEPLPYLEKFLFQRARTVEEVLQMVRK